MRTMLIERQFYKGQIMKETKELYHSVEDVCGCLYSYLFNEKHHGAKIEKTITNRYASCFNDIVIVRVILGDVRHFYTKDESDAEHLSLTKEQEKELGI